MNLYRSWAVAKRHLYHFKRNWDRLSDSFYWPVMDLIVWGLTTVWLQSTSTEPSNIVQIMLTAVVFWQIVWRANYEISVNLLEETWSGNVSNLFSSPLTIAEWIVGVLMVGGMKVIISLVVGFTASWILYSLNLLTVGALLVPFLASLILFGWALGFFASALILRYGRTIQTVAWMSGFIFAPLSAVYYPVSVLPVWLQPVCHMIPTTYVFEGMRQVLRTGAIDPWQLAYGLILNLVYLAGAITMFLSCFEYRRSIGLQRLD